MKFQLIRKWFTKSSVVATNLNLELRPQANEINISPNLIYVVITPLIDFEVIFLYVTKSCVSAAKLNLELNPQANDIRISSNLIYDAILPLIGII